MKFPFVSKCLEHARFAALVVFAACGSASAQTAVVASTMTDLSQLSIEQLENLEVTSVSKRPEPLAQAAAAIYVITADDIRRSGATSLPEALRLAPNLEVARVNAFTYTITARGFNSPESSNKLLVLIDGRSVYTQLASTVFWQGIDVQVADIDRIEVVSGPGGTLYGANAVNGVINVITKASANTQDLMLNASAGDFNDTFSAHYGGTLSDFGTYRVYLNGFHDGNTKPMSPSDMTRDAFQGVQGGFRTDGKFGEDDSLTVQADMFGNHVAESYENLWGENALARWGHDFGGGSALSVQFYWDKENRDAPALKDRWSDYDLQVQHNFSIGESQRIVWGGEFRAWQEGLYSSDAFFFAKPKATLALASPFVQDEIALGPGLKATIGVRAEYNSYSGLDMLPNARLAWQAAPEALFWVSISRAVRTPSRVDRELISPGLLIASPNFESEKLTAYEAGYRGQILPDLSLSVSGFYNRYADLRNDEYTPITFLPIQLQNDLKATTYGVEIWGDYTVTDWWRLRAGLNSLHKDAALDPGTNDVSLLQSLGQDPPYQAQLRSEMNIGKAWELNLDLRSIGHVERPFGSGATVVLVSSYVEADARIAWHVLDNLELALDGQNLLHNRHLEVYDPSSYPVRTIPRSIFAEIRFGL